jgi:phosphate transport system substrate-binding protein
MVQKRNLLVLGSLALVGILILSLLVTGCVNSNGKSAAETPVATPVQTTASASEQTAAAPAPATQAATAAPTVAQTTAAPVATPTPAKAVASGTKQKVTLSGSTTVLPIAQDAADAFMAAHPNYDIKVSGGGSGVGVQAISKKTVDIGMSSRDLTKAELAAQPLIPWKIARDGVAIVVNPSNKVTTLSLQEIQDIYRGQFNNWNQLGGDNVPIVIIGRDSASGTREFFYGTVMQNKAFSSLLLEKNSNGAVAQTVAQTPGAIGYLSIGYLDPSVKAVNIDMGNGKVVAATIDNVNNGSYPLSRYLYFITNGMPNDAAKAFIDFVLSADGQKIVAKDQYVPLTTS